MVKNTLTSQISTLTLTSPAFHSSKQPQGNEEAASGGIFLQITPNIGWCPCLKECLKGLLLTMKGTYFDVGGLLVLPFSRDCR